MSAASSWSTALAAQLAAGTTAAPDLGRPEDLRHGFTAGKLRLLVGYAEASALTDLPALCRLPNTPHWFAGMANLRGIITPVFDIARFLNLEHATGARQMLLCVTRDGESASLLVDGTTRLINAADFHRLELEAKHRKLSRLAPFFTAAYLETGGSMWFDFAVFDWLTAIRSEFVQ